MFTQTLFAAAGQVDLTVSSPSGGNFERTVADQVGHVTGIAVATPSLRKSVAMPTGSPVSVVTVVGIDPRTSPKVHTFNVSAGRLLNDGDAGQVVIGSDTAETLGLHVGSTLKIPTVAGTESFTVVGLLANGSSPSAPEVYVTLADAQRMTGAGNTISTVEARFEPGADRAVVEAAVRRKLGSDYLVGWPLERELPSRLGADGQLHVHVLRPVRADHGRLHHSQHVSHACLRAATRHRDAARDRR